MSNRYSMYRPDIDGLRAIAVIAVIAFHAFPNYANQWGGFIGVDIFFVISGYLISTIIFKKLENGTFSFSEFYIRRIKRIFPALILVLVSVFIFGYFSLLAIEFKHLGKHITAGAFFFSNFVLRNEVGYFDNAAHTKPLLHLWSLSIEEQFYIIWPVLLWLVWKQKFNVLIITLVIATISFVLNLKGVKQNAITTFYSPETRFWELLSGSLLAWVTLHNKVAFANFKTKLNNMLCRVLFIMQNNATKTLDNVLSLVALFLLLYGFYEINMNLNFPGKWALVPVSGTLIFLVSDSKAWVNRIILSNKIVVWFGLISFPLYLWHWVLLSFARIGEIEAPSLNMRIATVALSVMLAWLTYKFVERPIRFGKHGGVKALVLILIMSIVGFVGYNTYVRDGLPFRIINKINNGVAEALSYDVGKGYRLNECFIDLNETNNQFSSICGLDNSKKNKMLMIWGDSHAASLYRGFEKLGNSLNFSVSQFSAGGCPPILDFYITNTKKCIQSNKFVFEQIKILKPDILVLSANWEMYDSKKSTWEDLDIEKFNMTIKKIKLLGIPNIIIIGQLPSYYVNQINMLRKKFLWSKVNTITYKNFSSSAKPADEKMKNLSLNLGINFISPIEILCQPVGCLISIPGDNITPLSFDGAHLTTNGSEFLVSKFFDSNLIKFW